MAKSSGVKGFSLNSGTESDDEELDTRKLVADANRKKMKSGGFQAMGLSRPVFRGIQKQGYKFPTLVQRKSIPLILKGKDALVMSRTGSGKTACFLIPLFEKLKTRSAQIGARALILSPTKELALQTLQFFKQLGTYTGLKAAVILGGHSLDGQFSVLHENPDVIIATPGRFVHVCVEMELKLQSITYVVFDEADELFRMECGEDLYEILKRLPEHRQTLLFSASLPKVLAEFARAGLTNPEMIRLDVDSKLSENLSLAYFRCGSEDRTALLLYLLKKIIKVHEKTIVFVATKHDVEFVHEVLDRAGILNTYLYSSLDPTARTINVDKFRTSKVQVFVVTDIAARGIDVPLLDVVVNYNFPCKPKLFLHRVGRVARAGRSGMAFSLVSYTEIAHLLDLHLFLGKPLQVPTSSMSSDVDGVYGNTPQSLIDEQRDFLNNLLHDTELVDLHEKAKRGYMKYQKHSEPASVESCQRAKKMPDYLPSHPLFLAHISTNETKKFDLLEQIRAYKPSSTIFEIGKSRLSTTASIMAEKRSAHQNVIDKIRLMSAGEKISSGTKNHFRSNTLEESTEDEVQRIFNNVVKAPKRKLTASGEPKAKKNKDLHSSRPKYYINYTAPDHYSEKGLSVISSFEQQTRAAVLDFTGDDEDGFKQQQQAKVWDKRKKNYVTASSGEDRKKKIRTEAGTYISASYKSGAYEKWCKSNKVGHNQDNENDYEDKRNGKKFTKMNPKSGQRGGKSELKSAEDILKKRRQKMINRWRQRKQQHKKSQKSKGRR